MYDPKDLQYLLNILVSADVNVKEKEKIRDIILSENTRLQSKPNLSRK